MNLDYDNAAGCAILTMHQGSYAQSLTLGSRDDILIDGNITQKSGSDSVLGLIAQRFVRVKHDVQDACGSNVASGTLSNITIEAAILALNDSFIVDNWGCGAALQKLTIKGAIAQKFRGPVGMFQSDGSRIARLRQGLHGTTTGCATAARRTSSSRSRRSWRIVRNNEQVQGRSVVALHRRP